MKQAFTLIELLIVIAIIGILTTITLSSYSSTKQVAEINMQTDILVSTLREAKGKAQNGTTPNCNGFKFTTDNSTEKSITAITIPYKNQFEPCDILNESTNQTTTDSVNNSFILSDIELQVTKINIIDGANTQNLDQLYFLHYPPKGEFLVYTNNEINTTSTLTPITFTEIQIETKLNEKENNNIIKIQNSGLIQKARKTEPSNTSS